MEILLSDGRIAVNDCLKNIIFERRTQEEQNGKEGLSLFLRFLLE